MIINGGYENLYNNLVRQLSAYWGNIDLNIIQDSCELAVSCLNKSLSAAPKDNKYIWRDGEIVFNPFHSVQYSLFLYYLSHQVSTLGFNVEADALYYLNKIMNSVDWYHEINLPEAFYAEHPIGSVLGRAEYGEQFFIYQHCTVGGSYNREGKLLYPVIGNNVRMYSNSSILGGAVIGNNVIVSAGTRILNDIVPNNSIVFGVSPELTIKTISFDEMQFRQRDIWERLI